MADVASPNATHSAQAHSQSRWRSEPAYGAYWILRIGFVVLPLLMGVDKFTNVMTDWSGYLAPWIDNIVPGTADQAMYAVGVIEIVAGLVVWFLPKWGSLLVMAWLVGIIIDLLTYSGYYDVALRDFGLFVGAAAVAALAWSPQSTRPKTSA